MQVNEGNITLSATDLVAHAACDHLTVLDWQQKTGERSKPDHYDPLMEILQERGFRHEAAFVEALSAQGIKIVHIPGVGIDEEGIRATREAMESGAEVVVQAALRDGVWSGRADILIRVDTPSELGGYSYQIVDTKLARETKGATILQLCLYADLLAASQGTTPEYVGVVVPWSGYEPQWFRVADYAAYYRRVKQAAEDAAGSAREACTYPDPKPHCDMCRWQRECEHRRRADDHLSLVAGITKSQINEWRKQGIETVSALAQVPVPLTFRPERGSAHALERSRHQAAIQAKARQSGTHEYELLDLEPGFGLTAVPEPSRGDIFFDIESDAFVGEHGLEYLLGYAYQDDDGDWHYDSHWALKRKPFSMFFSASSIQASTSETVRSCLRATSATVAFPFRISMTTAVFRFAVQRFTGASSFIMPSCWPHNSLCSVGGGHFTTREDWCRTLDQAKVMLTQRAAAKVRRGHTG
jgi:uncharacterized protein